MTAPLGNQLFLFPLNLSVSLNQSLGHIYRIYSNKRRGAYLIFRATSAALIRGRRLFEGGAYLNIVPDKFTFSIFLFNSTLSIC